MINLYKNFTSRKFILPLLASVAVALVSATPASSTPLTPYAWTAPSSGSITAVPSSNTTSTTLVGDVFTANDNVTVTELGIYNLSYSTYQQVGLFDSSGNLLSTTSINPDPNHATLTDNYWWTITNSVNLTAGQQYALVVYNNGSNPAYADSSTSPTDGWATFNFGETGTTSNSYFPNKTTLPTMTTVQNTAFYGANIMATSTVTPEPESLLLLGTGLVGLAGFLKLKLRKN